MSLLTINSEPAERERGCVFSEPFVNASKVIENGGAITGTPLIDFGVTLDGTNDYLNFDVSGSVLNKAGFGCAFYFLPSFDPSDNVTRYFYQWNPGTDSSLYFVAGTLYLRQGGIVTGSVAYGTYGSLWNLNGENNIVVSSTTGDSSVWLNGTKIIDANAVGWTPNDPVTIFLGSNTGGSNKFAGTFKSIKFFNKQLSDQEALDYSNGGGFWNYENEAVLNLPMDLEHHDPTNTRTLDISGNGYHGAFGASTAAPTKNTTTMGYLFDNTNDYIQISNAGALKFEAPTADFTLSCWVKFPTNADGDCIMDMRDGNDDGWALRTISTGSIWAALGAVDIKTNTGLDNDVWHHVVAPINRSGNSQMYVDGAASGSAVNTSGVTMDVTSTTVTIGNANYASLFYDGNISKIKIWGECLTPMQIKDLYLRELRQINDL